MKDIRWEQIHVILLSWHFSLFRMPPSSIWKPDILMYNRYSKEQKYLIFDTFTLRTLLYVFYRYLIRENIFIGNINGNNIVMLQRERGVWWNLSDQCGRHQWRDVHLYSARYYSWRYYSFNDPIENKCWYFAQGFSSLRVKLTSPGSHLTTRTVCWSLEVGRTMDSM